MNVYVCVCMHCAPSLSRHMIISRVQYQNRICSSIEMLQKMIANYARDGHTHRHKQRRKSTHMSRTRLTHPYTDTLLLLSFTKSNAPGPCTSIRRYFVRLRTSTIAHRYLSLSQSHASVVTACVFICFVCTHFSLTNMHH